MPNNSPIMQFKTKDNYAISLQGKWGCGKTSVLTMSVEEIRQLSEVVDNNEKIVIVQFNPWNFTVSLNDVRKREEETLQRFQDIYPENPQVMLKAVASLFPMFSNRISFSSVFQTPSEIHQAMRIASESKFDLYFSLSLDNIKISRNEIDDSLLRMEENELRSYIDALNERDLFDVYLKEIKYNLSRILEERIELILSMLVFQSGRIAEKEMQLIGGDSTTISVSILLLICFRTRTFYHFNFYYIFYI